MKIETVTTYKFEAGDVIRMRGFFIVAVRTNGPRRDYPCWTHTSGPSFDYPEKFSDDEVQAFLEKGDWVYMGNTNDSEK